MAEIEDTYNPVRLVPGDPEFLRTTARTMAEFATTLDGAAEGLDRLAGVDGWSGPAAEGFRATFAPQPDRWREASRAFDDASRAVTAQAEVLEWARGRAVEAVRQWEHGRYITATTRSPEPAPGGPFIIVGEDIRQAADAMLHDARDQVLATGDRAAAAVAAARDLAPPAPGFWAAAGDGVVDFGARAGNVVASLGNAALHHPADVAAMAVGGALASVSAAGAVGSVGLDATGVGAVAGIPLGAVSTAGVVAGVGIGGAGAIDLALNGAASDRVAPFQVDNQGDAEPGPRLAPADRIPSVGERGNNGGVRTVPDQESLEALYEDLSEGGEPFDRPNYNGRWVRAPDGTEIGMRHGSSSGGDTIDAVLPNGQTWKIHIK